MQGFLLQVDATKILHEGYDPDALADVRYGSVVFALQSMMSALVPPERHMYTVRSAES